MDSIVSTIRTVESMTEEPVCGSCCHFRYEDIDGWGICEKLHEVRPLTNGIMNCSDLCTCGGFVSESFKRHQMAVLRQCQRCLRRNIGTEQALDVEDICYAIDFLVGYCKSY